MSGSNFKRLCKSGLIGLFDRLESRPQRYTGAITALYHEVGTGTDDYCVAAEVFEAQMDYLSRNGVSWFTASELADSLPRIDSANNLCITFDDGDRSAFEATLELVEAGGKCTHYIIPGRIEQRKKQTMSWTQLRQLDEAGVEIGSHSMSHPHLTRLSDKELECELADSKRLLEDRLGRAVTSFAYPYGEHDRRVVDRVRAAGYGCAFTTSHFYVSPGVDRYRIPRFEPTRSLENIVDLVEGRAHLFYRLLEKYLGYRNAIRGR